MKPQSTPSSSPKSTRRPSQDKKKGSKAPASPPRSSQDHLSAGPETRSRTSTGGSEGKTVQIDDSLEDLFKDCEYCQNITPSPNTMQMLGDYAMKLLQLETFIHRWYRWYSWKIINFYIKHNCEWKLCSIWRCYGIPADGLCFVDSLASGDSRIK